MTTTLQQRVQIQVLAQQGLSDAGIAARLHMSRFTVRKWRRRLRAGEGPERARILGRPRRGVLTTFAAPVVATLRLWRQQHPGWGPKTLCTHLRGSAEFRGLRVPSLATVARWLRQEGLQRPYRKHAALPTLCVSLAFTCHEEWEMDARGYQHLPDVGVIGLINLNDVFSHVKVLSYPCWLGAARAQRHPTTEDYQLVLRLAFSEWGLPDRLAVDHDSVFHDNQSASPFPTRLHRWLLGLGVNLTFGRPHQPRDQAMTERSHQVWAQQVLVGQTFASYGHLWRALEQRRTFLNEALPCASLGEQAPLVAHPEARRPRRVYRPEAESQQFDAQRIGTYLAQGRWYRRASNVGAVMLGEQRYCLGTAWQRQEVAVTFEATTFTFRFESATLCRTRPAQGLRLNELCGELQPYAHFPQHQLALPFEWPQWRQLHLAHLTRGTTL